MTTVSGEVVDTTPPAARRRPAAGPRWSHLALTTGVALAVPLLARLGVRLEHPGPLMLVPLAYVAAVAGTPAGLIAGVPLVAYYAYHFAAHREPPGYDAEGARSVLLFTASAGLIAVIVGRSTARRRTLTERAFSRERAENVARLQRSESLNRAVLDSLPAHVAVLDPAGRILLTNDAWRRFQRDNGGSDSTCAAGSNYLDACRCAPGTADGDTADRVAGGIEAVLRGERELFTLEYPCHAPGEPRWFLLSVTPLAPDPGGTASGAGGGGTGRGAGGAVVTHLNITERKLSEDTTRQRAAELAHLARALKRTNEELDQFAYITSHDLRAPLRGIANLSSWIEEDMGDRFTPEAHEQMEMLRGRVHRMEAMIDGILEYSRVGRIKATAERIDVAALLAEVIDLLDPPEGFTIEVEAGMPVVVGHQLSLQQVFMNLIGNALKHHDKPAGRVAVGCRDVGELVEFTVRDDGPGIEPQYHEKIFVIFQTLQPRDKVEGTGVGLSLVKKIVEAEGGTIAVESEVGRGTTFRFTWPRGDTGSVERGRTSEGLAGGKAQVR